MSARPGAPRLLGFGALALFAAAHAALFVEDPPLGRVVAVVAIAAAGGLALERVRLPGAPRGAATGVRVAISLLTLAAALVAAGLPIRLLAPRRWDDLADGIDRGLAGVPTASWPYGGDDDWVRLVLLLLAPVVVTAAAVLAFWPARRAAGALRIASLVLLVALFAVPATERLLPAEPARGLMLFVLVGAWLWLPRLRRRDAVAAGIAVLAAGLLALPAAARLSEAPGWVDYESWAWAGDRERAATFDWGHSYGPIDWPREGKTLLNVRSAEPHYWRVQALDRFDGLRWVASGAGRRTAAGAELPGRGALEQRWVRRLEFTVRNMRSDLLVAAGTPLSIRGAGAVSSAADGTTVLLNRALREGDRYRVDAYVPDPSAARMRAAGVTAGDVDLRRYTEIGLPPPGVTAIEGTGLRGDAARTTAAAPGTVNLGAGALGVPSGAAAERRLLDSPYARMFRLARRLTAGAPTTYDAVRAVERHLRGNYRYSEEPPNRAYPLAAFLFQDQTGYCQQFSGAMTLMLRMNGIPARVATGFSPGSPDERRGEFRVRDLDAHSWVEVYFAGIGWVPFDPTPSVAPAQLQAADGGDADSAPSASRGGGSAGGRAARAERVDDAPGGGGAAADGGGSGWPALALAGGALAAGGVALLLRRRRGRTRPGRATDPEIAELEVALRRLGYPLPPGVTLAALEHRLGVLAGPAAARHVRRLRQRRYAPASAASARPVERGALRRALTAGRGPVTRLRGWLALPPAIVAGGGPRRRV